MWRQEQDASRPILPDDFKLPTAFNTAIGFGWR